MLPVCLFYENLGDCVPSGNRLSCTYWKKSWQGSAVWSMYEAIRAAVATQPGVRQTLCCRLTIKAPSRPRQVANRATTATHSALWVQRRWKCEVACKTADADSEAKARRYHAQASNPGKSTQQNDCHCASNVPLMCDCYPHQQCIFSTWCWFGRPHPIPALVFL